MSRSFLGALLVGPISLTLSCAGDERDVCATDDADGIAGGQNTFLVTVTDSGFEDASGVPSNIFTVQNMATVTINLTNESSVARGFVVECLPTENDQGCPQEVCIEGAEIAPIEPGASATVTFEVPPVEGLYEVSTGVRSDTISGQLNVQ